MTFSDEEREVLVEGLDALMRRLRDAAKPSPSRRDQYSPSTARAYHLAAELITRLKTTIE